MIGYVFLSAGVVGTGAFAYFVSPAGRGAHRLVVPRFVLAAQCRRLDSENGRLSATAATLLTERQTARRELDDVREDLAKAGLRIGDLEEQLAPFDELRQENTRLRSELSNARSMRQLSAGPAPADDASALPDDVQQFVDDTATAWRASA